MIQVRSRSITNNSLIYLNGSEVTEIIIYRMCMYEAILAIEKKLTRQGWLGNGSKGKGMRKCWPGADTLGWWTVGYC